MTAVLIILLSLIAIATIITAMAVSAQKVAERWYEYRMNRAFDKMVEREQRRYRRR